MLTAIGTIQNKTMKTQENCVVCITLPYFRPGKIKKICCMPFVFAKRSLTKRGIFIIWVFINSTANLSEKCIETCYKMLGGKINNKANIAYKKYRANNSLKNNSYDFKISNTALINNQSKFQVQWAVKHYLEIPKLSSFTFSIHTAFIQWDKLDSNLSKHLKISFWNNVYRP